MGPTGRRTRRLRRRRRQRKQRQRRRLLLPLRPMRQLLGAPSCFWIYFTRDISLTSVSLWPQIESARSDEEKRAKNGGRIAFFFTRIVDAASSTVSCLPFPSSASAPRFTMREGPRGAALAQRSRLHLAGSERERKRERKRSWKASDCTFVVVGRERVRNKNLT